MYEVVGWRKEICENSTVCLKSLGDKKGKTTLASKHCYAARGRRFAGVKEGKRGGDEIGGGGRVRSNQVVTRTSPSSLWTATCGAFTDLLIVPLPLWQPLFVNLLIHFRPETLVCWIID